MKKVTLEDKLIHDAMRDVVIKALHAKSVDVHINDGVFICYNIDGVMYDINAAINKLLGSYSWWNDLEKI